MTSYLDLFAILTGVVYILAIAAERRVGWVFGFANALLSMGVFYYARFYGEATLQIVYAVLAVYGWWAWRNTSQDAANSTAPLVIQHLAKAKHALVMAVIAVVGTSIGALLYRFTDAAMPFADALLSAGGLVATYLTARKITASWYYWIAIDLCAIGVYSYRGIVSMAILSVLYALLSIYGLRKWQQQAA